jgi:hypothetical protein
MERLIGTNGCIATAGEFRNGSERGCEHIAVAEMCSDVEACTERRNPLFARPWEFAGSSIAARAYDC